MTRIEQEENDRKGRFIIYYGNEFAGEIIYTWAGKSKFIIDHTGVQEQFKGKGLGKQLVMKTIDYAKEKKVKVLPLCPFAKSIFDSDNSLNNILF